MMGEIRDVNMAICKMQNSESGARAKQARGRLQIAESNSEMLETRSGLWQCMDLYYCYYCWVCSTRAHRSHI